MAYFKHSTSMDMELPQNLAYGFSIVLNWQALLIMIGGVILGIMAGADAGHFAVVRRSLTRAVYLQNAARAGPDPVNLDLFGFQLWRVNHGSAD